MIVPSARKSVIAGIIQKIRPAPNHWHRADFLRAPDGGIPGGGTDRLTRLTKNAETLTTIAAPTLRRDRGTLLLSDPHHGPPFWIQRDESCELIGYADRSPD
jgi:hypothetical protein